jgi:hypothetical protein
MANLVDRVFNEVCLDERITDGVFRMEEAEHMNALRDYFVKRGITREDAIHVTNRMMEGKYPDRQAYRKEDGILVTWPSPQYKKKAMQENPGKYMDKNPFPKKEEPEPKEPSSTSPDTDSTDASPEEEPTDSESDNQRPPNNLFDNPPVSQDGKQLSVEPPPGSQKPATTPAPVPSPAPAAIPRTPEYVAAEKEVVTQIMNTDDTTLANIATPVTNETIKQHQLRELYKKADEWGFLEAVKFLTPYVKP